MTYYSWKNRADYANFTANGMLDAMEAKTGRLPDQIRDLVLSTGQEAIRNVILDVVEEMRMREEERG
ncbi:hypothetical protein [Streptomyces tsukubensis]|uniref:hypothetical protein n=1 Tax=Streptomyces tsukubensis TaxID=83656 RepID=UPI00344FCC9C